MKAKISIHQSYIRPGRHVSPISIKSMINV